MPCKWRCRFYSSRFKFAKNDSVHAIIWWPRSLRGRQGKRHHYQHHVIHVQLYFHVSLSFVPVFVFFLYPHLCPYFHTPDFPFSVFTPTPISQSILLSLYTSNTSTSTSTLIGGNQVFSDIWHLTTVTQLGTRSLCKASKRLAPNTNLFNFHHTMSQINGKF